ncbi:Fc.00g030870.m01.CDS01 [Cosmosporella sp. VM-42]
MCRMIVFLGACTRCGENYTWTDLSQELSCLEAKNRGAFGECSRGINLEEHSFDQECDRCADEDEGIGDLEPDEEAMGNDATLVQDTLVGKRAAEEEHEAGERKKQKT